MSNAFWPQKKTSLPPRGWGAPRACACACVRRHAQEATTGRVGFDKGRPASSELVQASVEGLNEGSGVSTSPRLSARPGQFAPREHRGERKKWGLLNKGRGIPDAKDCPLKGRTIYAESGQLTDSMDYASTAVVPHARGIAAHNLVVIPCVGGDEALGPLDAVVGSIAVSPDSVDVGVGATIAPRGGDVSCPVAADTRPENDGPPWCVAVGADSR